jgi:polyferredoxin
MHMLKIFGRQFRLFRPRSLWIRKVVQAFFFALIGVIAVNHTLFESGQNLGFISYASVHALCPFGGIETLYLYFTSGALLPKLRESAVILMMIGLVTAVLFGPALCGWVCPLGTVQEWVSGVGKKLFRRRFNHFVPEKLDRILRYARYGVLIWVIYVTAQSATLIFADYDPYLALFHFWTGETAVGALVVLGITLGLSLLVERPWCKYACPYGALLGLSNLFRIFSIKRAESTCKADGACSILCPMNIPVDSLKTVRDHQCISCLECTSEAVCPVAKTVLFTTRGVK